MHLVANLYIAHLARKARIIRNHVWHGGEQT
jgi:hypothetical protein